MKVTRSGMMMREIRKSAVPIAAWKNGMCVTELST
jgi:hypothetical protein